MTCKHAQQKLAENLRIMQPLRNENAARLCDMPWSLGMLEVLPIPFGRPAIGLKLHFKLQVI